MFIMDFLSLNLEDIDVFVSKVLAYSTTPMP